LTYEQSLNIALVSHCDCSGCGLIACGDTIIDVNIIADYIDTAMAAIKGGIYLGE
jgi:hypothetical protein